MKSAIFSFIALILGAFIAFLSYSTAQVTESPTNISDELFIQHDAAYLDNWDIVLKDQTKNKILSIGDADLIVFPSSFPAPKLTEGKIEITRGIYLIGISDPFHEYSIHHAQFSVEHVANGTYVIDTTWSESRIYSLTAFLRVSLLHWTKVRTTVDVFPSEHFVYDPSLGDNYDWIDVFRVWQLARLELINYKNKEDVARLGGSSDSIVEIIGEYEKFLKKRTLLATEVVKKFTAKEDDWLVLLEKYGSFFINDAKRKVILQNSLIWLAQSVILHDTAMCIDACLKNDSEVITHTKKVKERIESLMEIDSAAWENAKKVLRRYLSLASMISTDRKVDYYTKGGSILVSVYQNVFQKVWSKGAYRLLTELYSQYYFPKNPDISQANLQSHLEKSLKDYVVYLVNTKSMKEDEFIWFVYFLKEFLSTNREINSATVELFSQIVSISGSYVATIAEWDTRFQGLSVVYYTFSNIWNRLYENILSTYFTLKDEKIYLKPEYVLGTEPNLPQGLIAAVDKSLKAFDAFNTTYGDFFVQSLNAGNSSIIDSKSLSENAFEKLRQLQSIVSDYQNYLVKASLKEGGEGTLSAKVKEMHTPETVKTYFSQFQGLDMNSFTLVNDPKEDGFYRIAVNINERRFRFAYLPETTVIREIVFVDLDNTFNQVFRSQTINLEQKKKAWGLSNRSMAWKGDPKRFDFAYFFENTFFPQAAEEVVSATPEFETREEMSPEMKRFVNFELIKKDFTYIEDVLPLGISNIHAKVENGAYVIKIYDAKMTAPSKTLSYNLKISSDYIYNSTTNAFSNMRATIYVNSGPKDPTFGWTQVRILPELIAVDVFSEKVTKMADLINLINTHYQEGSKNIVIDLDSNRIEIDGTYYVLPTP
jgi:hypothetical protein